MKNVTLLIFLIGISFIGKSQSSTPFNITNLKYKDQKYKCDRPVAIKFSTDENYLYIGFNTANSFKLIKYDCENAKVEFEYFYEAKDVYDFVVSPDDQSLIMGLKDGSYYIRDFKIKRKLYKLPAFAGAGWINENQFCCGPQMVFDISLWTCIK
mgnify:CR=1 FL=1